MDVIREPNGECIQCKDRRASLIGFDDVVKSSLDIRDAGLAEVDRTFQVLQTVGFFDTSHDKPVETQKSADTDRQCLGFLDLDALDLTIFD